ncbi:xylulose kinase [Drosophila hydei]|uniref:Xylulose kinase n=1 Tax=Drosophila hydei TaxID=7224 RepID=A0A6J1M1I4_DROHY|nr:xylulose kinase [Drosophila hydei]
MCHPTVPNAYMTCYHFSNGGLVRERICREVANDDWKLFNQMLINTPKGNDGNIAVHFDEMEYIPKAKGSLRWNDNITEQTVDALHGLKKFDEPRYEARAVIEGQLMHHVAIINNAGFRVTPNTKIIVTGECSNNATILQIVADVFNGCVYRHEAPADPCLIGAAYRARYAFYEYREVDCNCVRCKTRRGRQPQLSYTEFIQQTPNYLKLVAEPTANCEKIYVPLMLRCTIMQQQLADMNSFNDTHTYGTLRPL